MKWEKVRPIFTFLAFAMAFASGGTLAQGGLLNMVIGILAIPAAYLYWKLGQSATKEEANLFIKSIMKKLKMKERPSKITQEKSWENH